MTDVVVAVRAGDRIAAALLAAVAEFAGGPPTVVHTGAEVDLAVRSRGRDLVVIDPDVVALTVASGGESGTVPAVVAWLSIRSSTRSAKLLDAGADDVVDAAMSGAEIAARLRRVRRQRGAHVVAAAATFGGLRVDARLHEASWRDQPLPLTPREMEVLQVLAAAGGSAVPREAIYRQVWSWTMPRGDRTVDVNIKRLRAKLADSGVPVEIVTQPGIGYRLGVG